MKSTVRVRLCDRKQAWGHFFVALLFASFVVSPVFLEGGSVGVALFLAPIAIPFCIWSVGLGVAQRRLHGLEVICSEEGIGAVNDNNALWELPWERFGGYRWTKQTVKQWILHPEHQGVELLDRSGAVYGVLPLGQPKNSTQMDSRLISQVRREIERRVPEDGVRPEPPQSWLTRLAEKHPKAVISAGAIPAILALGLLVAITQSLREGETPTDWRGWFFQGARFLWLALPILLGSVLSLYGWMALSTQNRAKRIKEETENRALYEGPSLVDHRLQTYIQGGKVAFVEGVPYRYVQPEVMKEVLRSEVLQAMFGGATGLIMMALAVATIWTSPGTAKWFIALPIAGATLVFLWARAYIVSIKQIEASLSDTLVWSQGVLTVDKTDGERLTFPMPQFKPMGVFIGSARVRVEKHAGKRYAYDPSHMYAVDEAP